MKKLFSIVFLLFIISCKDIVFPMTDYDTEMEIEKVSIEMQKFDDLLIKLYSESEKSPEKVIIKADSLLAANKNEDNIYRSQIKSNIENSLHYLKAELFYKIAKYKESIKELETEDYKSGEVATAYAANYVKLKDYVKAKSFIDSIGKHWYIYDYALGNYYESIGNKDEALKIYNQIKKDKSIKHYAYYKLAVNRFEELQKTNPKLLNEIYYPTGNPSFEIADSDSENRTKIFKLMEELPENQDWAGTGIIESPQENDKNYYWVKVKTQQGKEYNYYIYQQTFEIKYFDIKKNKLMTLEEWRKSN